MLVLLLLAMVFIPAFLSKTNSDFDYKNAKVEQAIIPLLIIGAAIASLAVGIYTFLQMRKMQKKNQPKPSQIDGTIADEGVSFCDIAGSPHVHPNITDLWNKKSKAIKKKSGGFLGIGKTSQVTGYRYYTSFSAFIGNRIEKFLAINFDNRGWIVHDPMKHPVNMLPVDEPSLFGQDEGGVVGNIDLEFGYPQPQQNLAYKQHFDLVSAYPYQSYLVFRGNTIDEPFYFGNSNYMKEMLLSVKRIHVKNNGDLQWHDVKSEINTILDFQIFDQSTILNQIGSQAYQSYKFSDSSLSENEVTIESTIVPLSIIAFSGSAGAIRSGNIDDSVSFEASVTLNPSQELTGIINVEIPIKVNALHFSWGFVGDLFDVEFIAVNDRFFDGSYIVKGKIKSSKPLTANLRMRGIVQHTGDDYLGGTIGIVYKDIESGFDKNNENPDINPIHKIREILTDDTSMAKPETDVNDQNFVKAANRIWDEGLGVSWAIDEKSCIDAIEELCYHIEAGIRVNRQTGLYEMVLFRDDWFAEYEIHTIAENKIKDLSLEVMNSDDIVNQLNVTYYDRERIKNSTFSVYENGSILTMGKANAESIDFPYFMNMRNAEIVANWKLKQYSTPAWKGTFTTGWREARKWNRYDLVKITWSKKWQGTILARIMKIDLGNGLNNEVMIDFEEVVPYSGEMNTSIVVDDSTEIKPIPPQPAIFKTFEIPYYDLAQLKTQAELDLELAINPNIGFVGVVAGRPQQNSIDAQLHTESDVGYELVSSVEYASFAVIDEVVNRTQQSFVVKNEDLSTQFRQDSLIMLGDEIVIYKSYDTETKTLTVERGALDTIPQEHEEGEILYFYDDEFAYDPEGYTSPRTVNATVLTTTPSGVELLETSMKRQVEIESRAIRPYPPSNVKINGEYFPSETNWNLNITWIDRDRMQTSTILGWYDSGEAIEPGVTYFLEIYEVSMNDVESVAFSQNVGNVNSYIYDASLSASHRLKIVLYSIRNEYESYYKYEHYVAKPLTAPQNLTAEFIG